MGDPSPAHVVRSPTSHKLGRAVALASALRSSESEYYRERVMVVAADLSGKDSTPERQRGKAKSMVSESFDLSIFDIIFPNPLS